MEVKGAESAKRRARERKRESTETAGQLKGQGKHEDTRTNPGKGNMKELGYGQG